MHIFTPSIPRHVRITDTMIEDLVWDPVMAAYVLLGRKYDDFQKARLRLYWFVPIMVDSSGFSSGKTIVDFDYIQLRCLLFEEHDAGVYYPTFETGKNTFWEYYNKCQSAIFRAHLGSLDEDNGEEGQSRVKGAACFKAFYRNGSKMLMPAPSFLKAAATQASMRFNTLLAEEWTHIDAMSTGIDDQLIGRVTKPNFNKNHPVRCNHIHFTAPAKTQMHPAYPRYAAIEKAASRGDVTQAVVSFCYKDYSNRICHTGKSFREEYRVDTTINLMRQKHKNDRSYFLGEGLGIWSRNGRGWFTEELIAHAQDLGRLEGIAPISTVRQLETAHAE